MLEELAAQEHAPTAALVVAAVAARALQPEATTEVVKIATGRSES